MLLQQAFGTKVSAVVALGGRWLYSLMVLGRNETACTVRVRHCGCWSCWS